MCAGRIIYKQEKFKFYTQWDSQKYASPKVLPVKRLADFVLDGQFYVATGPISYIVAKLVPEKFDYEGPTQLAMGKHYNPFILHDKDCSGWMKGFIEYPIGDALIGNESNPSQVYDKLCFEIVAECASTKQYWVSF